MNKLMIVIYLWLSVGVFVIAQDETTVVQENLQTITNENISDITLLAEFTIPNVIDLDWSSDGSKIILGTFEGIWILDVEILDATKISTSASVGYDVAFVDGTSLIAIGDGSNLHLYDTVTDKETLINFEYESMNTISGDGLLYVTVSIVSDEDGEGIIEAYGQIYSTVDHNVVSEIPVTFSFDTCYFMCVPSISISPDNTRAMISSASEEVQSAMIDLTTNDTIPISNIGYISSVFSPDSLTIASAIGTPGYIPSMLAIIDTETGEVLAKVDHYLSSTPAFSSHNDLIAVGVYDDNAPNPDEAIGYAFFYDVENLLSKNNASTLHEITFNRPPVTIEFSPNGKYVVISDGDGNLGLWGLDTGS